MSTEKTCLCFDAREGTVRYADQSACLVHRTAEAECGACGGPLDAACDHCCAACLDGETCPACDGASDGE